MNKTEVTEIKKIFKKDDNGITRICGCYVDGEKNKRVELKEAFYSLPEEEMFKYVDIFRKTMSGTLGKNLMNMESPMEEETNDDGKQKFMMKLPNGRWICQHRVTICCFCTCSRKKRMVPSGR